MATKVKLVRSFVVDKEGLKKIGKSFIISVGGLLIAILLQLTDVIDFGTYQSFALVFLPWLANTLKIWIGTYESKE